MSKKTTKTAHVMSILTKNGVPDDIDAPSDETINIAKNELSLEKETDNKISQAVQNGLLELLGSESDTLTPSAPKKPVQNDISNADNITKPAAIVPSPNTATSNAAQAVSSVPKVIETVSPIKAVQPVSKPMAAHSSISNDYMVVPEISEKPSFAAPPGPDGVVEYTNDSQFPTKFDLITNVKEFTPELFFDPEDDDQFPESYFTEKEKNKMTNYEVTKLHAENEDYICVNVVEEITAAMLSDVMTRFGLCQCEKCKADVMAIALNDLTPKYVGTYKGQLFVKLAGYEKQYSTDVLSALTKACIHVKSNPRHE